MLKISIAISLLISACTGIGYDASLDAPAPKPPACPDYSVHIEMMKMKLKIRKGLLESCENDLKLTRENLEDCQRDSDSYRDSYYAQLNKEPDCN